jgi:hypothetical protein
MKIKNDYHKYISKQSHKFDLTVNIIVNTFGKNVNFRYFNF